MALESTQFMVRNVSDSIDEKINATVTTTPPPEETYSTSLSSTSKKGFTAISSGEPTYVSHIVATSQKSIDISGSISRTPSSTTPTRDINNAKEDFTFLVLLVCGLIINYMCIIYKKEDEYFLSSEDQDKCNLHKQHFSVCFVLLF